MKTYKHDLVYNDTPDNFELLDYRFFNTDERIEHGIKKILIEFNIVKLMIKYGQQALADEVNKQIISYLTNNPDIEILIPVLNFHEIDTQLPDAELANFFKNEIKNIKTPGPLFKDKTAVSSIIVLNLSVDQYRTINVIQLSGQTPVFWNENQFILLYNFKVDERGNKIFHTDMFGGERIEDLVLFRNKLGSTHIKAEDNIPYSDVNEFSEVTKQQIRSSPLFTNSFGVFQNFEVIIKVNTKTLFEYSMEYVLNTNIDETQNGYVGYKIKDSHFRLGSKIHIKDFIYAKRIFQNSFFANRFAYLLAIEFLDTHTDIESLTIIGYGIYSQLLINRLQTILSTRINNKHTPINYDMVNDVENPHFIKNVPFNENILVVVPINTTFSTTIKIEKLITDKIERYRKKNNSNKRYKPLYPSMNLILVTDGDFNDIDYIKKLNRSLSDQANKSVLNALSETPYKTLNWTKIDPKNKIVHINTNPPTRKTQQRYFISIASEIYLPETCPLCFPNIQTDDTRDNLLKEDLLLETDKASVTPDMVVGMPENFFVDPLSIDNKVYLPERAVISGHSQYMGNHFSNFIRPDVFFTDKVKEITAWALECKRKLTNAKPDLLNSGILLITVGERNNNYFADFINQYVFEDSATILSYDIAIQEKDNFLKFFSVHVWQAKYIFYVDDIIQRGQSFFTMNDLIIFCNKQNNNPNKAIDSVFTLISKNHNYTRATINSNLSKVFDIQDNVESSEILKYNSFYYLHLDPFDNQDCPLCVARKKNITLAKASVLDSVKHYFYEKALKLKVKDITQLIEVDADEDNMGWSSYNPFVIEYQNFPWTLQAGKKGKKLADIFKNNKLPSKAYLKLIVHHELNAIFSSKTEIKNDFLQPKLKDSEQNAEMAKKIFFEIRNQVKKSVAFEKLYEETGPEFSSILDDIIDELVIKVLTGSPFDNLKCIKEKVFLWVNWQLYDLMDNYQLGNFEQFRKLKFLMRKSALFGSNFLIRTDILIKLKNLYDGHAKKTQIFERHKAPKNKHVRKFLASTQSADEEQKFRRRYVSQAHRNIEYMETSVRDFGYYFISLLKQITFNNDAKTIRLEKNIDQLLTNIDSSSKRNFLYYLRLVKYENVALVKKGASMIYQKLLEKKDNQFNFEYICRKIDLEAGRNKEKEMRAKVISKLSTKLDKILGNAMGDYRLLNLKRFLDIDDYDLWAINEPERHVKVIRYLLLSILLKNESRKPGTDDLLNAKTKVILELFYSIVSDNSITPMNDDLGASGGFLVLRYQEKTEAFNIEDKLFVAETVGNDDADELLNNEIGNNSLSKIMLNGVSNRNFKVKNVQKTKLSNSKKPWILWEIGKDPITSEWQSLRGDVFPIGPNSSSNGEPIHINEDFTEALYLSNSIKRLTYFRLSEISLNKSDINNQSNAVIGIYSDHQKAATAEPSTEINRLRLSFILLPQITAFLQKHYDSSMLNALVQEKKNVWNRDRNMHGNSTVLDQLRVLARNGIHEDEDKKIADLMHHLLMSGSEMESWIKAGKNWIKADQANLDAKDLEQLKKDITGIGVVTRTLNQINTYIQFLYTIILKNNIQKTTSQSLSPIFSHDYGQLSSNMEVEIATNLFDVVMAEALINAKNNSSQNKQNEYEYNLRITFKKDKNLLWINLSNNCKPIHPKDLKKLNTHSIKKSHGLNLIDSISKKVYNNWSYEHSQDTPKYSHCGGHEFTLTLPIAKIK